MYERLVEIVPDTPYLGLVDKSLRQATRQHVRDRGRQDRDQAFLRLVAHRLRCPGFRTLYLAVGEEGQPDPVPTVEVLELGAQHRALVERRVAVYAE